uniref:Head-to-tail adaptor n=1 Tax=Streptomyces sp. NBC_00093 TaxID=2975649 RepID=A0AAU2A059_9ACTN
MALAPLATLADLAARGLTVSAEEETVAETYLDVASTAVREGAGVPISQTTSTVSLEGPATQWLTLPGPPIVSVATVEIDGEAVTDFKLRSHRLWRRDGWSPTCDPSEVDVTQTHGLATVPSDIVDLVCRIAATALADYRADSEGAGLAAGDIRAERIGDYSVTYGDAGLITTMELPDYLRERLEARFGGGVSLLRSR